jgi:two-component system response regulator TtrR
MPQMSGFQLHEKLFSMGSKLKVIMITAHPQDGDRKWSTNHGILAFLEKPINDQVLIDLLKGE